MKNKVLIVGQHDPQISHMFLANGWEVTYSELDPDIDLVQFTGGADIDPSYYKEEKHPATQSNPARDAREAQVYLSHVHVTPMAGICRGGQFLNVMNGGKMWQHVNNHIGNHQAFDHTTQENLFVTSTHHQMMIPTDDAVILMTANRSTIKQGQNNVELLGEKEDDIEALYYPDTECLCFQPHPEYLQINHPCQTKYFNYLNQFFGL